MVEPRRRLFAFSRRHSVQWARLARDLNSKSTTCDVRVHDLERDLVSEFAESQLVYHVSLMTCNNIGLTVV